MSHRWSGWPGAWCLDCGCDDPVEQAIADGNYDVDDETGDVKVVVSPESMQCPEPGSRLHDPYGKGASQ